MGENVRFIIPSLELKKAGNLIQVTLGHKGTDWSFDRLYVGHPADAGDPYDFNGAQNEVTFGGSSGGTISSSGGGGTGSISSSGGGSISSLIPEGILTAIFLTSNLRFEISDKSLLSAFLFAIS